MKELTTTIREGRYLTLMKRETNYDQRLAIVRFMQWLVSNRGLSRKHWFFSIDRCSNIFSKLAHPGRISKIRVG